MTKGKLYRNSKKGGYLYFYYSETPSSPPPLPRLGSYTRTLYIGQPVAEFINPWLGSQLRHRVFAPVRQAPWMAGLYDNPMTELTLSPSQGFMNSATGKTTSFCNTLAISLAYLSGVEEVSYHFGVLARGLIKTKKLGTPLHSWNWMLIRMRWQDAILYVCGKIVMSAAKDFFQNERGSLQ